MNESTSILILFHHWIQKYKSKIFIQNYNSFTYFGITAVRVNHSRLIHDQEKDCYCWMGESETTNRCQTKKYLWRIENSSARSRATNMLWRKIALRTVNAIKSSIRATLAIIWTDGFVEKMKNTRTQCAFFGLCLSSWESSTDI